MQIAEMLIFELRSLEGSSIKIYGNGTVDAPAGVLEQFPSIVNHFLPLWNQEIHVLGFVIYGRPFLSSTLAALVRRLKIASYIRPTISEFKSLALMESAG